MVISPITHKPFSENQRTISTVALILALAASFSLLAGCKPEDKAAPSGRSGVAGAVPVVVEQVRSKGVPLSINAVGAVESLRSIAVKSLVAGLIWKVNFKEGQEVRQGELLFEIDPRPFKNAVNLAEADLQKSQALLETAESEVSRYSGLRTQGMVSNEQFQTIENNERSLKAQLASNQAALANAKLQLEYCSILAPCDGRTGELGAHEGDLVSTSNPQISLITITQISPIYVTFSVPQQNLADIRRYINAGKIVVTAAASSRGASETGELVFIDNAIDPATGTIKLKASFDNNDRGLWPGQFASVKMTLAVVPNQLVVPTTAVQQGQKGYQVFVVRENKTVDLRSVKIGNSVGQETVITKGLKEGETVVVDGQVRLRPGVEVEIKPAVVDPFSAEAETVTKAP